jgi:type III pantothenate kinase
MNLVIDIGNSTAKLAVYRQDTLIDFIEFSNLGKGELEDILSGYPEIKKCILSSVRKEDPVLKSLLRESVGFFLPLDRNTPLPIKNLYRSKSTLGYDRIAAAVGANARFPEQDLLVIDAGTAITIDLVTADNAYLGGNISPGLSLRFRALNEFTDNLPLVKGDHISEYLGSNTESAIVSGVLNGIIYELDGYINELKSRYSDLRVIMTGGDVKIFDKKLKNSIFVDSKLNLFGLHRILQYNAEG